MGSAQSSPQDSTQQDDTWWNGSQKREESVPQSQTDAAETLQTLVKQVAELKEQLITESKCSSSSERLDPGGGHPDPILGPNSSDRLDPGGESPELELEERQDMQQRRLQELDLLKKDLSLKREARQKKLSAVSAERERLRNELSSERAQRIRLQAMLSSGEVHSTDSTSLAEELCKVREDLAKEKIIRDAVTAERDSLSNHNKEIIALLEKTSNELRKERASNESLVVDNEKMASVISEGEVCLETMREELNKAHTELREVRRQVLALKDVASISGQMLAVREVQVKDMKRKLSEIEAKISRDSVESTVMSLREEYETRIKNIKELKQLYEDRAKVLQNEKEKVESSLREKTAEVDKLKNDTAELEEKLQKLQDDVNNQSDRHVDLELQLGDSVAECKSLNNQMSRINDLFTQMLLGAVTTNGMDLDKMSRLLHENHDLIADITSKESGTDHEPALPKLILDLLNQIEREAANENASETEDVSESSSDDPEDIIVDVETVDDDAPVDAEAPAGTSAAQEDDVPSTSDDLANVSKEDLINQISSNLPKVWKVLMELVSQQGGESKRRRTSLKGDDSCYKAVETPRGPQLVISVSKTYIKLKDLILEKRHLEYELSRLKNLNGHLETRLDEQEQRLSLVQTELHKTWDLVGRMKVQHQQLHTHEKILRYELHQKRELLNELKQELEYCREKWESARQKNTETAREWRQLRREFAARRARDSAANNSGESGLGEEETSCEDDADGDVEDSSGRSESPMVTLHEEPQQPEPPADSPAEDDNPVVQTDELAASEPVEPEPSEATAASSIVTVRSSELELEPALVAAIVQETEPEHSAVELHTEEESQIALVSETEPIQSAAAVVLQTEAAHAAAVLESQPTQVAAVVMEMQPQHPQVAVVSQSPPGVGTNPSSATMDDNTDGLAALKARALIQFAKRSAEYLQEQAPHEEEPRPAPLSLPRRTRMQPARTSGSWRPSAEALQNVANPQSVFGINAEATIPNATSGSPSFFFGTRSAGSTIDFESDVAPQIERPIDTVLDARAARLQRLEEQAQWLANRVNNTTQRSQMLSSRLTELHEQYGPERPRRTNPHRLRQADRQETEPEPRQTPPPPPPPPMPERLPTFRLPTEPLIPVPQSRPGDLNESEDAS